MKILITGDLVINQKFNAKENIDDNVKALFEISDFNIVSLEVPVTESKSSIIKTGLHLKSDKQSTLDVLKSLNIHVAALANNHIKNYDEQGVLNTIEFCTSNNIKTIGAGKNLKEASTTIVINTPEGKIALINIAENEWSSADEQTAGANGMNLIKDTKAIQQAKKENEFVFVIVHGGHEYYNLPSPRMQEQYRFYAEQGADLVVGHHTHCVSGYELYQGTPIYYSLGNFLFTKSNPNDEWYTGLILEVAIHDGEINTKLHPVKQTKETFVLTLLKDRAKDNVLERVQKFSKVIIKQDELWAEWNKFVTLKSRGYLSYWSPKSFIKNRYVVGILNRLRINLVNITGLALYLNLMRCEAHRDLSHAVLQERLKK